MKKIEHSGVLLILIAVVIILMERFTTGENKGSRSGSGRGSWARREQEPKASGGGSRGRGGAVTQTKQTEPGPAAAEPEPLPAVQVAPEQLAARFPAQAEALKRPLNLVYFGVGSDCQWQAIAAAGAGYRAKALQLKHLAKGAQPIGLSGPPTADTAVYALIAQRLKAGGEAAWDRDQYHANLYSAYILSVLGSDKFVQPLRYLDYGCGDGVKAAILGKQLGLAPHGTDIRPTEEFAHYDADRTPDIEFKYVAYSAETPNKIDWPDAHFGLVTCFMVLHHVRELSACLQELARVTAPGGLLVLREHDVWTGADAMLCDIEHGIFDRCYKNAQGLPRNPDFARNYYARYLNYMTATCLIEAMGFRLLDWGFDGAARVDPSPTRYIHLAFRHV